MTTHHPDGGAAVDPAAMLDRLFAERYTCRRFLPASVPRATIEQILAIAQRAPSWCNTQPWQLEITTGAATEAFRTGLRGAIESGTVGPDLPFPETYRGVYAERRKTCAVALYDSLGITGDRDASGRQTMRNFDLFDAPHVAVLTTTADLGVYGVLDCGVYLGALLSAATACGVATAPQAAPAMAAPFIREFFDLAENRQVVCAVSFGYADPDAPENGFRTERAGHAEVVRFVDTAPAAR